MAHPFSVVAVVAWTPSTIFFLTRATQRKGTAKCAEYAKGVPTGCLTVLVIPLAQGCSDKCEGCVQRIADTSGEPSRKDHRTTGESSFAPIRQETRRLGGLTSRPATSLGSPIAYIRNEEPLIAGGRSTALCRACSPLPAGIRNALRARCEHHQPRGWCNYGRAPVLTSSLIRVVRGCPRYSPSAILPLKICQICGSTRGLHPPIHAEGRIPGAGDHVFVLSSPHSGTYRTENCPNPWGWAGSGDDNM